jgi:hypothetical protein
MLVSLSQKDKFISEELVIFNTLADVHVHWNKIKIFLYLTEVSSLICLQSQSHFIADSQSVSQSISQSVSQSVSMSWCRVHFVDVSPDIASFSRAWV